MKWNALIVIAHLVFGAIPAFAASTWGYRLEGTDYAIESHCELEKECLPLRLVLRRGGLILTHSSYTRGDGTGSGGDTDFLDRLRDGDEDLRKLLMMDSVDRTEAFSLSFRRIRTGLIRKRSSHFMRGTTKFRTSSRDLRRPSFPVTAFGSSIPWRFRTNRSRKFSAFCRRKACRRRAFPVGPTIG